MAVTNRVRRRTGLVRRALFWSALCAGGLVTLPAWGQSIGLPPIAALHQNLRLTAQQEPAWKAYRDAASVPEKAQGRRRAAAKMFPTLTAPQRIDLIEAEMRQELADLQQQSKALKAFYAVLLPEQKRVFDTQTLPPQGGQAPAQ